MRDAAPGGRRECETVVMGSWTYYSPLWIGPLLVAILSQNIVEWDYVATAPPWAKVGAVVVVAIVVAIALQIVMFGAQGAFAQVIPAPGGRSIRGGGAVFVGWMILAGMTLLAAAFLFETAELLAVWRVVGGIGVGCGLAAAAGYAWSWPMAQQDFKP